MILPAPRPGLPMPIAPEIAAAIDRSVDACAADLLELSRRIHQNPELRFQEHKAARWIGEFLTARGHVVEQGVAGMDTALRSRSSAPALASSAEHPRVAILAEYDALPGVGHACGHNLIAIAATGAFVAAASVAGRVGGEVVFLGTPAEEGGGGKIEMLKAGVFEGIGAAMMFHPFDRDVLMHPTLASVWVSMEFRGTPAHAAVAPYAGRSALTACLDTFRLIDGQRVHFRDGVRVHGYVTDGGQAVNIIPERAACDFSVRALDGKELQRVRAIVERCARAAAMASDVEVTLRARSGYRDMVNNGALARSFGGHLRTLGRHPKDRDPRVGTGSTDMGDVSHVVPSIHPWLAIVEEGEALCHEHRFADAAGARRRSSPRRPWPARPSSSSPTPSSVPRSGPTGPVEKRDVDLVLVRVLKNHVHELLALGHLGQAFEASVPQLEPDVRTVEDDAEHLRPCPPA
jgi:amidohydrolase